MGHGADGLGAGHASVEAGIVVGGERVVVGGGDHRPTTIATSRGGMVQRVWRHVMVGTGPLGFGIITVGAHWFLFRMDAPIV